MRTAAAEEPPAPAAAEDKLEDLADLSLEQLLEVTVTAAKVEQSVEEAPAIVEVVNHKEIRRRGYRTVADALQHVAGLYVIDDYVNADVGVRGVFGTSGGANEIIKVMLNGQPIAFRPTASSALGYDLVPIEAVERIEVVRGPGSALYGANAFLGVINVVTFQGSDDEAARRGSHSVAVDGSVIRNPEETTPNGSVSVLSGKQLGSFRYLVTGVGHRGDRSGLELPIGGGGHPSPGWDPTTRRFMQDNAVTRDDTELAASLYGLAAYELPSELVLQGDGHLQYSDRTAQFQDFGFLSPETRLTQLNGFGRLRLTYRAEEAEGLSSTLSMALSSGGPTDDERIDDRLLAGAYERRRFGYDAMDLSAEARYGFDPTNSLTFGTDYTYDAEDLLTMQVVNERTGIARDEPGFGKRSFINLGGYLQWMYNPWRRLVFTLGSRVDHNTRVACDAENWSCLGRLDDLPISSAESSGVAADTVIRQRGVVQLSNRAAVVYPFEALHAYAKLIYGTSYKPPSPFQLYHREMTLSGSSVGNPALKPQTAQTLEANVGMTPIEELQLWLTGFATDISDMVVFLKEGERLDGRNADLTITGLEANVATEWSKAVTTFVQSSVILSSRLEPQQRRDETDLSWEFSTLNGTARNGRYPDWMLKGGVNLQPSDVPLNVNLLVSVIGPRRASLVNAQLYNYLEFDRTYTLPAYVAGWLTLSTVGLQLLGPSPAEETVVSLSTRYIPGGAVEPGYGGLDIPSLGPSVFLRLEQRL